MYILVIKQLLTMTIIGVGGFIFAKAFKTTENERKFLSKLLLYFINPCMVVNSFNREFNSDNFVQFLFVTVVALVIHGVMILIGVFSSKSKIDRISVVFTNCGFIGIPLIRGVFGDECVFYLMGYLAVFNTLVWTYGYYQVSGAISVKKILTNPNIIAVVLGIIVFCLPFDLPEVIGRPLAFVADLNTATSMILIGILMADFKPAEGKLVAGRLVKINIIRMILCSVINIAVLFAIYKLFPNIPDVRILIFVILICSMCPVATSVPGLACVFDREATYASMLVSISSLLCIITLPSFVALAENIIK